MRRNEEYIDFEGYKIAETPKAYLVEFTNTGEQEWVPRSQMNGEPRPSDEDPQLYIFSLTEWIAKQKGLI